MKILAHVHGYPPKHNAGAEHMLKAMMEYLVEQGHECVVLANEYDQPQIHNGVTVAACTPTNVERYWKWCHVGLTHLEKTSEAILWAMKEKKWVVHIVHNTTKYRNVQHKIWNVGVCYNNEYSVKHLNYQNPSVVVRPPVSIEKYKVEKHEPKYVTLINCNVNKGGHVLVELAKRMPDVHFLGVIGSYAAQVQESLPNLTYWPTQTDARKIYEVTRVLIMPSVYESWGRTATEAACNGIPVVANPTFGLVENLGSAGIFCDVKNINHWQRELNNLLTDSAHYKKASEAVKHRAIELDSIVQNDLLEFDKFLTKLGAQKKSVEKPKPTYNMKVVLIRNIDHGGYKRRGTVITVDDITGKELIAKGFAKPVPAPIQQVTAPQETKVIKAKTKK
jgi:glycosyltransferase involved in cell wall biosynthesis